MPELDRSDLSVLKYSLKTLYGREREDLAWRLLDRFGGAPAIFAATTEELMTVKGVTSRAASFFTVVRPMYRQALLRSAPDKYLTDERALVNYAAVYFMYARAPQEVCVCTDKQRKIVYTKRLTYTERLREIATEICRHDAYGIALMRYCPEADNGKAMLSSERRDFLSDTVDLLQQLDAELIDCIDIAGNKYRTLSRITSGELDYRKITDTERWGEEGRNGKE